MECIDNCSVGTLREIRLFSNEGKIQTGTDWDNLIKSHTSIWRPRGPGWWWQCNDSQHLNGVPVFKNVIKTQFATWFISGYKVVRGVVNRAGLDNFPQLFGHTLKIWSTFYGCYGAPPRPSWTLHHCVHFTSLVAPLSLLLMSEFLIS